MNPELLKLKKLDQLLEAQQQTNDALRDLVTTVISDMETVKPREKIPRARLRRV